MRDRLELTGMILSSTSVGDYDKRLVILTKERGKITAFARGARKPNSAYLGVSEPFNFGTFYLTQGYDAYHLVGAEIKEYFLNVKNDIEGICYGTYFCDILEYCCVDGIGDVNVLNLSYFAMKALSKKDMPYLLIRRIFELKMLQLEGIGMQVFSCANCGSKDLVSFCVTMNGLVCKPCAVKLNLKHFLNESTIYALQYVLSSDVNKLFCFRLSEDVFVEFSDVVESYFNKHISRKFKSLEILSSLS